MFKKILIANRGEIAVRIMATCREMGIHSVAVYSEADSQARHVRLADEAYALGPAPATQSYLNGNAIIDIARQCGAEAIHPGYGFLSENDAFAEACEQAGIVFIGPPASAMRLMGSKIAAKQLAQQVDVPVVPGYSGESQDVDLLQQEALRIGFPLLIKASAGGGGKGMRVVQTDSEFREQLAGAQREAKAAFGDETVFLERYIQQPRHIEIQILADTHGNIVHLGERECSIQRRHQKIVEESPSVALTPELRTRMGEFAIRIARAAGYINAGTLEFMLDQDENFYFLEMNTRLQVEHPVTELITGLDLVRHQLLIAAGKPLTLRQETISPRGHAIEVRIYAEDAQQNFLPSTGTITAVVQPDGPGIRLDSGTEQGDEITQYYDPMIAKLIVYGEDRAAAIERLQRALAESVFFGVTTNISLLYTISQHPAFQQGETYTNFLEAHGLLHPVIQNETDLPDVVIISAALYETLQESAYISTQMSSQTANGQQNPWQRLGPWRIAGGYRKTYRYQEHEYSISLQPHEQRSGTWNVQINAQHIRTIACLAGNNHLIILTDDSKQTRAYVHVDESETQVALNGKIYHLQRRQPPEVTRASHMQSGGQAQKKLKAPMAGTIVKVQVHNGDIVEAHQVLLILSAMKMEHSITAPYTGKIQHIYYQEGAVVPGGAVVVEME